MDTVRKLQMRRQRFWMWQQTSVLVASTGVIGMQVPIDRIKNGVKMMAAEAGMVLWKRGLRLRRRS